MAGTEIERRLATVAVLGPGRIGRQIALACALGGCRVRLVDLKLRPGGERAALADARREIVRDLGLMAAEGVIKESDVAPALDRLEEGRDLAAVEGCGLVQEALPERLELKRDVLGRLGGVLAESAIVASATSSIAPAHLASAVPGPERFLVVHWLNPAHIIPLVEVVPGSATSPAVVERTVAFLRGLGKTPVRCADSPGFIVPRMQALLMNEAVRLVEEGVATPEAVDEAVRAGLGFRYATVGVFEFIDWGGVDILHRASHFMAQATGQERFRPPRLVEEKMARNELGPKTGRGFFDYPPESRDRFETAKVRALLRQLRREREGS
jgi:3-hydroxybutyryl-CoA dehydrogenase